jgi:hypothetical protein
MRPFGTEVALGQGMGICVTETAQALNLFRVSEQDLDLSMCAVTVWLSQLRELGDR